MCLYNILCLIFSGPAASLCTACAELPAATHRTSKPDLDLDSKQEEQLESAADWQQQHLQQLTNEDDLAQEQQQHLADENKRLVQRLNQTMEQLRQLEEEKKTLEQRQEQLLEQEQERNSLEQRLEQLSELEEERNSLEQRLEQLVELEEERNSLEQRLEQALEEKCELEELENDSRLREELHAILLYFLLSLSSLFSVKIISRLYVGNFLDQCFQ
jgi:DNA repair exonuclease SbcCD ATPase subunit